MKGIIFNLLEQVVTNAHGEDAWDDLLAGAGLEGVYTSLGNYPDEELLSLVSTAGEQLGETTADLLHWFGRQAIPILGSAYPTFFEGHTSVQTFLPTINDIIHAEVRKIYPDADVPVFGLQPPGDHSVTLVYTSERHLCPLAEGFILGAADRFGEEVTITQPECMLRGDSRCVLECSVAAHAPQ